MMLALGLEASMAGYAWPDNDVLPQFKSAYEKVTKLSDKYPSQEVLLAAAPDFITGWKSAFSEKNFPPDFLQKNDIAFFIPYSEYSGSIDAVYKDFTALGQIFRVEKKAAEIITDMKNKINTLNDKVKNAPPVRVFVYDSGADTPYTAGAALASDLIRLAGGENVFAGGEKNWMTVQWESVVEKNPAWIVVMEYSSSEDSAAKINTLKTKAALQGIDAVKNNRIMTLGLSDVTAGIRNISAVERMAKNFHPAAFK
jgi:iron complex transport system substrate-binding protein